MFVSPKPQTNSLYHGQIQLPLKRPPSGKPRLSLVPFTVPAFMRALLTLAVPTPTASLPSGSTAEQGEGSGMLTAVKNPSCTAGDCREGGLWHTHTAHPVCSVLSSCRPGRKLTLQDKWEVPQTRRSSQFPHSKRPLRCTDKESNPGIHSFSLDYSFPTSDRKASLLPSRYFPQRDLGHSPCP